MLLRDKTWLWGHPEGVYNNSWGNDRNSRMTPMECCVYLGIRNTFMVPVGTKVSTRKYNISFSRLKEVGWECFNAAKNIAYLDNILVDAADFENIGRVVLDDFVRFGEYKNIPVENIYKIRDRLKNNDVRPLDMWMVLYTYEFGLDKEEDAAFQKYIEPFDGIIMWTWKEKDVCLIPEKFEIFKKMTPNQKRMFGCYLWNFGEKKPATPEKVLWQLDWYREKLYAGEAEGIVFHTNTMADLDLPTYKVAYEWMEKHGDEVLPD